MNIDRMVFNREQMRNLALYNEADVLRNELVNHSVFIIDTKQDQEVYHEGKGTTLKQFEDKIKREARAKKNFNAWLFTQQTKIKQHEQLHISKR